MCTEVFHHPNFSHYSLSLQFALKGVAQNQLPSGELPCPDATAGKKREIRRYSLPRAPVPLGQQGQLRDGTGTDPEANRALGWEFPTVELAKYALTKQLWGRAGGIPWPCCPPQLLPALPAQRGKCPGPGSSRDSSCRSLLSLAWSSQAGLRTAAWLCKCYLCFVTENWDMQKFKSQPLCRTEHTSLDNLEHKSISCSPLSK